MNIGEAQQIAKALGDPYRLKIVSLARNTKKAQCIPFVAIADLFNLSQPTIPHHLKQLTDANLLIAEKEGRNTSYKMNPAVLEKYLDFLNQLIL